MFEMAIARLAFSVLGQGALHKRGKIHGLHSADRRSQPDTSEEALKAELYQQIGQLQVELDWLKKKSGLSR
jgi:hypothetical protein